MGILPVDSHPLDHDLAEIMAELAMFEPKDPEELFERTAPTRKDRVGGGVAVLAPARPHLHAPLALRSRPRRLLPGRRGTRS